MLAQMGYSEDVDADEACFFDAIEQLKRYRIIAAEYWLNEQISLGKRILAEGAQGTMLDIDFGTYPFVTSSNTVTAGLCTGLGIAPRHVGRVYGISKAYCTRVGSGPFPTELLDEEGEKLRQLGHEFGATTGRPRRCGWIDLVALRYACMINGVTDLIITKADVLDGMNYIRVCTAYTIDGVTVKGFPYDVASLDLVPEYLTLDAWEKPLSSCTDKAELPSSFCALLKEVEGHTGVPVRYVSNGVGREQLLSL